MSAPSGLQAHVEKLQNPEGWPLWPVLPLKRYRDGRPETAWVTADFPEVLLKQRPTHHGIILQLRWELEVEELDELGFFDPRRLYGPDSEPIYRENIVKSYHTVEDVVDDGWVVD